MNKLSIQIAGDAGSIKELLTKLDPQFGNSWTRNCYDPCHGRYIYELVCYLDEKQEFRIETANMIGSCEGKNRVCDNLNHFGIKI